MNELELIIDLHLGNNRQGPGSDLETRRAIELAGLDRERPLVAADLGFGTGASALVLARELNARVTASDGAAPFVERLRERAKAAGLADRITARVGDMAAPEFEEGELDLIWSEGAIYNIGFEAGLRAWRRRLKPGGVVAVTELSWRTAERPVGLERAWAEEYPGLATASANLRALEEAGYRTIATYFLPRACWANYYEPLRAGFGAFLERHGRSDAAREIVAAAEEEMRCFQEGNAWYGYAFYIASKAIPTAPDQGFD